MIRYFCLAAMLLLVVAWKYQDLPMEECSWCHRVVELNRHHVQQQAARPDLKDVKENLVVLCRDCHFVLGHRCNWKQVNPDVMELVATYTNTVKLMEVE
jgi:hypothetical protein